MKAGLAQKEPNWLKKCDDENLYHKLQEASAGRPQFILHDGPPYANGSLHTGHALNKILKDIIVKSKMMSGFSAPYVPGWDCHGLPIEIQVEKKHGKVGQKIDAKTFRQKCREYATRQVEIQKDEFKRLGVIGEWDNPYLTKDFKYEADMIRALGKIVENGHVEKGVKPVNWCFDCGSALAEAEIEYQDKVSAAIDVAYVVVDQDILVAAFGVNKLDQKTAIPIWTTTPWTLPASMAVSLNAELEYSLVKGHKDLVLVVATALVNDICTKYGIDNPETLGIVLGEKLEGLKLQHPFYADRQVPVIVGEHVTVEAGTGAVHTAPGHGVEDFNVGKQYGIEIYNPMGGNGVFLESTPIFGGQYIWKANKAIVVLLKENNVLLHSENINHSYPHCWRHKSPTAFRTTPQWFISMDKHDLRKNALAEIRNVKWIPEWGESRIYSMIENRPEWCISRQRTWGVPITLFTHKETGELHPDTLATMEKVALLVEESGIDAWFDTDASELIADADNYDKTTDVLDVWFDSGVSHFAVLTARNYLSQPADLYLEGSDQHRGWFHSSLLTGVAINDQAPYKQVLTHGYVVGKDGRKMSKSLGNFISLKQVIDTYGADVLRLWCASADYSKEITISDEIMKRVSDGYRRIRNTARFLIGNLNEFDVATQLLKVADCTLLDQWAIRKAGQLQVAIIEDFNNYQFHNIYQKISSFCSQDMGAFYLDVLKDRLYTTKKDANARLSAQTAMYHILQAMIRWIAPIITYTADEIWRLLGNEEHVLFEQWYAIPAVTDTIAWSDTNWDIIQEIRNANAKLLEQMRISGDIGSSLDASVKIYVDNDMYAQLNSINEELRFVLITSQAQLLPIAQKPDNAVECKLEQDTVYILADVAAGEKCVRCWHKLEDVGHNVTHPELCGRCIDNIDGQGEIRKYA
ncbi:MAG: isoleucine--tRNA ligase [Proteobacteria bacterium]|nr:isoleucine--tRNA ligase [Pseudomonadota bacterium]